MTNEASARLTTALAAAAVSSAIGGAPALAGAGLAAILTVLGMPLFRRYALARPNARSSHAAPVPQGGGAAVAAGALLASWIAFAPASGGALGLVLASLTAAVLLLAVIGTADDIRDLPVLPRLGGQLLAVALTVGAQLASFGQILPVPMGIELICLVAAGAWFVNLTNFMDGIDGITLAGFWPLAAGALMISGASGGLAAVVGPALLGALAGFVWFNLPRAKLFLGDVGSLPIGLIGGALLLDLAQHGAFAAAVILPLYHFADATTTLLGRMLRREKVWEAHRRHAYQRAVDGGWSHGQASGAVLVLNIGLAGLAMLSVGRGPVAQAAILAAAAAAVAALIVWFRRRSAA